MGKWFEFMKLIRSSALVSVLLAALLGFLGAGLGCSGAGRGEIRGVAAAPDAGPGPAGADPGPRVVLIMKTLTNPFFVEMENGARKAQAQARFDLQVRTATQETSIEQQIELVEREIKAQAKAIVIAPGDSGRLVPVLKKAQDAGIAIVNVDNQLRPDLMAAAGMRPVPFIGVDNEWGAYLAAKHLADRVTAPTEAAILEGIRSAANARQRKAGAERAFAGNPNIRVVAAETAHWKIDEAYEVTRRLFQAHPRLGVLFCANDMMAIGAIKYLQETGRAKVLVAGFDALAEARTALKAGQLAVTVDQQADRQGYLGVTTALKLLHGESVPMDLKIDVRLVTRETLP
jgi:ribose transport system substrate-binding protein